MANYQVIHGYTVYYEPDAQAGVYHLANNLDASEARVFFEHAYSRGSAEFEDNSNQNYTLLYTDRTYRVVKR